MPRALRLRRRLQALRLSIEVVLRCGLQALRLGITLVALINVASLINLASEAWTLLSNDLSSVIFRQSTLASFHIFDSELILASLYVDGSASSTTERV